MAKRKETAGRQFGADAILVVSTYVLVFLTAHYFIVPNLPEWLNWLTIQPATLGLHAVLFVGLCYVFKNHPVWSYILAGFSLLDSLLLGWFVTTQWWGLIIGLVVWIVLLVPFIFIEVAKIKPQKQVKVVKSNEKETVQKPRDTAAASIGVAGITPQGIPASTTFDVADLLASSQSGQQLKMSDQELLQKSLDLKEIEQRRLHNEFTVTQKEKRVARYFELFKTDVISRARLNELLILEGEQPLDVPVAENAEDQAGPKNRAFGSNVSRKPRSSVVVESLGAQLIRKLFKKGGS